MNIDQVLDDVMNTTDEELTKENANLNGDSFSGKMNKFGTESAKYYALSNVVPKKSIKHMVEGDIYIHDLDHYAVASHNCTMIDVGKMISNGFHTGHGSVRPAKTIRSAMSLVAIIFQAEQNEQYGGVGCAKIDHDLAPFVRMSYEKNLKNIKPYVRDRRDQHEYAEKMTREETFQSAEAMFHNLNTMNSRASSQVPFTSINYGTDTSYEGRLVTEALLRASISGLGEGETPIFPISIFKVKDGINRKESDPNYDLYLLAVESMSKRFYPNIANIDSPLNLAVYDEHKPETHFATMGCRTRVLTDRHGDPTAVGRGNLSNCTVNLVKAGIESKGLSKEEYFNNVKEKMDMALEVLMHRWDRQRVQKAKNAEFLFGQGVWTDGEKLDPEDTVEEVLKHGTFGMGFIGLAESLKAYMGVHHGESEKAQEIGYELIKFMREYTDEKSNVYYLNISLYATPAEGLSGKFTKIDRKNFGIIEGVTDRDYYTNSYHVPVYHKITSKKKIDIEAPYHQLSNGGSIGYVEFDGNARENQEAFKQIIDYAISKDMSYIAINHPVDRCENCKYEGVIGTSCPKCGCEEEDLFSRIRRVTGYLNGDYKKRFNPFKVSEVEDRVTHS